MLPAPTNAPKAPKAPNAGTLRMVLLVAISALSLALLYHFSAIEFLRSGGASELLRSLGPKAPIAYVLLMGILMTLWASRCCGCVLGNSHDTQILQNLVSR